MALRIHLLVVFLLSLYSVNGFVPAKWMSKPKLGFSWGNCGPATLPLRLVSLSLSPDPIRIPGNETVKMVVNITKSLPDLHASLDLQKRVSPFWIKVPCEHNVGSCNYGNFCEKWGEWCPKYFAKYGFPCTCPIPPGVYSVPDALVDFTKSVPSQANGEFKLNMNIGDSAGQVGCFNFDFKIN